MAWQRIVAWLGVLCMMVTHSRLSDAAVADLYKPEHDRWGAEKALVDSRTRNGNGTIIFVHVHKGGGTTICMMVQANKLKVPPPVKSKGWMGKNCNPAKKDKGVAWDTLDPSTMVTYAKRLSLQFYAIESAIPQDLPWGQVAMMGVVRQPLSLMVSHCGIGQGGKINACVKGWGNRLLNLYYVKAARKQEPGLQNLADRKYLDMAKERLERFSLVLPLERLNDAGPLLEARFGWKHNDAREYRSGTHSKNASATPATYQKKPLDIIMSDPQVAKSLKEQSALDHELYAFACELFERQLYILQYGTPPTSAEASTSPWMDSGGGEGGEGGDNSSEGGGDEADQEGSKADEKGSQVDEGSREEPPRQPPPQDETEVDDGKTQEPEPDLAAQMVVRQDSIAELEAKLKAKDAEIEALKNKAATQQLR